MHMYVFSDFYISSCNSDFFTVFCDYLVFLYVFYSNFMTVRDISYYFNIFRIAFLITYLNNSAVCYAVGKYSGNIICNT